MVFDERYRYQRSDVDFCAIHGRFMRPMNKNDWRHHVERKHVSKTSGRGTGPSRVPGSPAGPSG
jgi:hypothetical protein